MLHGGTHSTPRFNDSDDDDDDHDDDDDIMQPVWLCRLTPLRVGHQLIHATAMPMHERIIIVRALAPLSAQRRTSSRQMRRTSPRQMRQPP